MDKVHLIGAAGIGMSALARILQGRKIPVSGSDLRKTTLVDQAEIDPETTVVYSSAIKSNHPEMERAKELKCRLLHRSDFLRELAKGYRTLAVTGTHGKTTISSMLAWVLYDAGWDPAFALGGILPILDCNGRHGEGEYFVMEADESDRSFLKCDPYAAIISNIEPEHLDVYGSEKAMMEAFQEFLQQDCPLIWCADDSTLQKLAPEGTSYGFSNCDRQITNFSQKGFSIAFELEGHEISVPLSGRHNAQNAAAVFILLQHLGMDEELICKGLASFPGVARRLQHKGGKRGVDVFDDYAHHPTEVRATLSGLREAIGKRRLIAIFQPHRYTRLQQCLDEFALAFDDADEVWITDVYPAGEDPIPGVDTEALIQKMCAKHFKGEIELRPHDVVVTMGAGDITYLSDKLAQIAPPKLSIALIYGGTSPEHDVSVKSAEFVQKHLSKELYDVIPVHLPNDPIPKVDCFFPLIHGPGGEDGLLAAYAEAMGIPYVGCDFRSASICMNKAHTKRIAEGCGVPTLPWAEMHKDDPIPDLPPFPIFVKPVHLGSSIGISKVDNMEQLQPALDAAFAVDDHVILEQGIIGRELHFAVLGDQIADPVEVLSGGEFNDYEGKYGQDHFKIDPNPDVPLVEEGKRLTKKICQAIGCKGMVRVDFFFTDRWFLNELNPVPGFSPNSTYPAAWDPSELFDTLIQLALYE